MKTVCISLPDKLSDIIDHYIGYLSTTRSRFISSCIFELMLLHDVFDFDFFEHLVSVPFTRFFANYSAGIQELPSSESTDILDSSGVNNFIDKDSIFNHALKNKAKNKRRSSK